MTDTNISCIVYGQMDMRMEERPIPEPGPGEVQVSMRSVGVCGSDLGWWLRERLAERRLTKPKLMGHEPSGVISKLGAGVTHLNVGDRVAVEPNSSCGICYYCKRGLYNHCNLPMNSGCLARYTCVPAAFVHSLPDNMSFDEGALVQPLALAYYACERSGVRAGLDVLVTGSGSLGMSVILAVKAYWANKICATDVIQRRLDFVRTIGADIIIPVEKDEDPETAAKRIVQAMGRQPDITIECSGNPSATGTAIFATRSRGMILQLGFSLDCIPIPLSLATVKELDIRGNHSSLNSYPTAIEAISSGRVNVKPLVSHRFTLEESEQAFKVAANKEGYKVVIDCSRPGEA